MTRLRRSVLITLGVLIPCAACKTIYIPPTMRTGPSVDALPGPPVNACEEARWVEAYPAVAHEETRIEGPSGRVSIPRTIVQDQMGFALYRAAVGSSDTPIDLRTFLPPLGLEDIRRAQMARIVDYETRVATSTRVRNGGLITLGSGIALALLAIPVSSESSTGATIFGLTGALAIVGGGITALIGNGMSPSVVDTQAAVIRERLFVPGEVDIDGVRSAVTRNNMLVRASCGTPTPATPPEPPRPAPPAASGPAGVNPGVAAIGAKIDAYLREHLRVSAVTPAGGQTVLLRIRFDVSGAILSGEVRQGSGDPSFDASLAEQLRAMVDQHARVETLTSEEAAALAGRNVNIAIPTHGLVETATQ